MSGISITHWGWFKWPGARIKNDLIVEGTEQPVWYHPGEDTTELLNSVQGIYNEQSALDFVKRWGLLGLRYDVSIDKFDYIWAATEFTYATLKKNNQNPDLDIINREVSDYFLRLFNPQASRDSRCLTPEGDSLAETIDFAQWVRYISEVKRLFNLYLDDEIAAAYEAEEWLNNLPPQWYERVITVSINLLKEQYGPKHNEPGFFKYVLGIALSTARDMFFSRHHRGVWIELYRSSTANRSQGYPVFKFDGLFRFIAYILLVQGGASPKKCTDPKCGRLFFPAKANQRYCPPPPGVKRSRCENRHGQRNRRHGIYKTKTRKVVN